MWYEHSACALVWADGYTLIYFLQTKKKFVGGPFPFFELTHMPLIAALLLSVFLGASGAASGLAPSFNTSFEGGNVIAQWRSPTEIEYRGRIVCGPASSKCSPYDNWVYFSVGNLSTTYPTTLLRSGSKIWASPLWFSYSDFGDDGNGWGKDWQRCNSSNGVTTTHLFDKPIAYLAFSVPYVSRQRERLFSDLKNVNATNTNVQVFTLATSEAGHAVTGVNISSKISSTNSRRALVWFQARQHAWETGGSWVADGIARFAGSGSTSAQALLNVADVVVVPIVDIDNVVVGGAGKDQEPVDFNRDWCQPGTVANNKTGAMCQHWQAIKQIIATVRTAIASGRYTDLIFVDSHSPGNPKEPAQVWTECQTGPSAISNTSWSRLQAYKYLLKTHGGGCGRLTYDYWCAEVGPAYGNSHSGYHSDFISFMYLFYSEYATLMNAAQGRSMAYSHETSAATVEEAHCYAAAIGTAWTAILSPAAPVVPPASVPTTCTGYPSTCHALPKPTPAPPTPAPPAQQMYQVNRAGTSSCNGRYIYDASGRRPVDKGPFMFVKDNEHQIYRLHGRWHIAHYGVAVYYDAPNATGQVEVPLDGWVAMEFPNRTGVVPPPELSQSQSRG
jgi:hypothetical protein